MRVLPIALLAVLLAIPAHAQGVKGVPRTLTAKEQQAIVDKRREAIEAEKSAKSALEKLPDKPYDPWRTSREPAPTSKR
jgi:hypothetical protein